MSSFTRKIKYFIVGAVAAVGMLVAIPAAANASGEVLSADFSLQPQSGDFLNNGFKPANWAVENSVEAVGDPTPAEILPAKEIDLTLPPSGQMTFNPGNMAVCPDNQVGPPPVNLSLPVPTVVARCPNAVIGNGTAKFVLGRNNLNPNAVLDGVMVVFNGGLKNGRPLAKVYAYSYDTQVAIYTEAALQTDGSLDFDVPQLTADSSVSELNLAIPSKNITLNNWGPGDETVVLPKGKKSDYVQAKCSTGSFNWASDFTFGTRDTNGDPTSPSTFSSASGSQPCVGVAGKAKIGKVTVKGPSKVRRNRVAKYRVTIKNTGSAAASGVRLRVSGRGIRVNAPVGQIGAGKSRTIRVNARPTKTGKIKAQFRVTSNNAGTKTVNKRVRVK